MTEKNPRYKNYDHPAGGWGAAAATAKVLLEQSVVTKGSRALLAQVAERHGVPRGQVAIAWLLSKPVITAPIIGATKAAHLAEVIASLEVRLSVEDIAMLGAPYLPHAVNGVEPPPHSAPVKLTRVDIAEAQ